MANVLGIDENILILEAYLDSAPPILEKALRNVYYALSEITIRLLGNELTDEQREILKKEILEQPLAKLVIQLAYDTDNLDFDNNTFYKKEKIDDTQYNMQLNVNLDFEVSDNAMEPILPKDSRTKLKMQNNYQNGEIIAFQGFSGKGK